MTDESPATGDPAGPGVARRVAGIALVAVCVLVAAYGITERMHEARWRADMRADAQKWATAEPPTTSNPAAWRARGTILSASLFPTPWTEAAAAYHRSLLGDPRAARTWLQLAEAQLFLGNADAARTALEQSDQLNPNYPRQRREAIRLWLLLGERERALDLASEVASLGGDARREALRELAAGRIAPEEALSVLPLAEATASAPEVVRQLAEAFPGPTLVEWAELLPANWQNATEVRRAWIEVALSRGESAQVVELWDFLGRPDLEHWRNAKGDPDAAPWQDEGPLGWQSARTEARGVVRWYPRYHVVDWEFHSRVGQRSQWLFYRTLVPPGVTRTITAEVQVIPPGRSTVWLSIDGVGQKPSRLDVEDKQLLTLTIPASDTGRLASIWLLRDPVGPQVSPEPFRMRLFSFEMQDVEEAAP